MIPNSELMSTKLPETTGQESSFTQDPLPQDKQTISTHTVALATLQSTSNSSSTSSSSVFSEDSSQFCTIQHPQAQQPEIRVQLLVTAHGEVQVQLSVTNNEAESTTIPPENEYKVGQVTQEQIEEITQVFTSVICNQEYFRKVLASFKLMLVDPNASQQNNNLVNQAEHTLSLAEQVLFRKISSSFKADISTKLEGMFNQIISIFPSQKDQLYQSLDIGCKMAILPSIKDLFNRIKVISPCYIGNLVQQEQASQKIDSSQEEKKVQ